MLTVKTWVWVLPENTDYILIFLFSLYGLWGSLNTHLLDETTWLKYNLFIVLKVVFWAYGRFIEKNNRKSKSDPERIMKMQNSIMFSFFPLIKLNVAGHEWVNRRSCKNYFRIIPGNLFNVFLLQNHVRRGNISAGQESVCPGPVCVMAWSTATAVLMKLTVVSVHVFEDKEPLSYLI